MSETPAGSREGPADDARTAAPDDLEVTCTLTDDGIEDRLAWVEENLLPFLVDYERTPEGFTLTFERDPEAYAAVAEMAWKESHCCAWATFDVEVPPGDAPIHWHGRSEREEGSDFFAEKLVETVEDLGVDDAV